MLKVIYPKIFLIFIFFFVLVDQSLACSFDNGRSIAAIQYANGTVWVIGLIAVLSAGFWILTRAFITSTILSTILLAFHPAWTVKVNGGDCGYMKQLMTSYTLVISLGVFIISFFLFFWNRTSLKEEPHVDGT